MILPSDELIPPRLFEPNLENRLRVIGRYLDEQQFRSIAINEVDQGMLVRAFPPEEPDPVLLEFAGYDFPNLIREAIASRDELERMKAAGPLMPTGYEDFLRALGAALDRQAAENVAIVEFTSFITVCGFAPAASDEAITYDAFSDALDAADVRALLGEALERRGTYEPVTSYYPPGLRGTTVE